ncbi:DUF6773 family protein [Alteribacillus sp. HJP-4]
MKDERITIMQNKIYKEIYILVILFCLGSIAVKHYLYGFEFQLIATELFILIGQGIYYSVRASMTGLFSSEVELHDRRSRLPMSSKTILIGLLFGAALSLYFGIRSAVLYGEGTAQSLNYFLITFLGAFMIYVPFLAVTMAVSFYISKKKSDAAVEKALKDDDE